MARQLDFVLKLNASQDPRTEMMEKRGKRKRERRGAKDGRSDNLETEEDTTKGALARPYFFF